MMPLEHHLTKEQEGVCVWEGVGQTVCASFRDSRGSRSALEGERCLQGTGLGWALWRAWLELCLGGWVRLEQARERKEPLALCSTNPRARLGQDPWCPCYSPSFFSRLSMESPVSLPSS